MAKADNRDEQDRLGRALNDMHQKGSSLSDAAGQRNVDKDKLSRAFGGFMDERYGNGNSSSSNDDDDDDDE